MIIIERVPSSNIELSTSHLLNRVLQRRQLKDVSDCSFSLKDLLSPSSLQGCESAAVIIANAIITQQKILIVGDYDVDGATSTALMMRVLKLFGAENIAYRIPNRMLDGYGLTVSLLESILDSKPNLIITVDNGISSVDAIAQAKAYGINVVVTDHHLPGDVLPVADAIVNPNLKNSRFESSALCGVGVAFYTLMAVRRELINLGYLTEKSAPNLANYLDLVALGTIADLVPLDRNNRCLVQQGIERIRRGRTIAGIQALLEVSGKNQSELSTTDIGFSISPLLNAAGRLDDMRVGIECLLTDSEDRARYYAQRLYDFNQERKSIERSMTQETEQILAKVILKDDELPYGIALYDPSWHQGVIGIVASRVKERFNKPTFIFAEENDDLLKGSGRSISGIHLRDLLDSIATEYPDMILQFGGHAMAAGLTLRKSEFAKFQQALDERVKGLIHSIDPKIIYTDGALSIEDFTINNAAILRTAMPWGQSFPEPAFDNVFNVVDAKILQNTHLKLELKHPQSNFTLNAIAFFKAKDWQEGTDKVRCVYKLDVNEWRGKKSLQLLIEHIEIESR
ncbi:single-stranded-DNA-specific exonuclease RecJ [Wohlfahrtiimonas larvae]|uniref:Single-stranded-DNA-specific exonuclease RecJ n=3 Tax=Wohlfahrtiimonas larvae TaxID=1157986 RepID=A0ABP9MY30_9GAMM